MWAPVRGCFYSDPERVELLYLRRRSSGVRAGSRDTGSGRISRAIRNTRQALRVGLELSQLILCCA